MLQRILEVRGLLKYFPIASGIFSRVSEWVRAVDNVSFGVQSGETFGLVGESGCGKTTTGRCVLRLIEPTGGEIAFKGQDLTKLPKKDLMKIRREMSIVFQNPFASLNPRMTVKDTVAEPLLIHNVCRREQIESRVSDLLRKVGLSQEHMRRFPHEFSGGQRQRITIARALSLNPRFMVLDEPTSALDVSVQAHILNLLRDLKEDLGLTYLFISHDLDVVEYMSDRIGVMYLGKMAEMGPSGEIYENSKHPYTRALFSSIPIPDPLQRRKDVPLSGEIPSSVNPPPGCRFHPRCVQAMKACSEKEPEMREMGKDHFVACHLY